MIENIKKFRTDFTGQRQTFFAQNYQKMIENQLKLNKKNKKGNRKNISLSLSENEEDNQVNFAESPLKL